MIKTFINKDINKLDTEVNDAMAEHCRNLPVRTEMVVIGNEVLHKATMFFDYDFKADNGYELPVATGQPKSSEGFDPVHNGITPPGPKPSNNKIGALWVQNTGSVSGMLNDQKIVVPPLIGAELIQNTKWKGILFNTSVSIIANKFKQTATQPNYVIFKGD